MSALGRSSGPRRLELDALSSPRSSVLPFLPTIVTALLIGSLSLLCRQPAAPEANPAELPAMVSAELSLPAETGSLRLPAFDGVPAPLAFAQVYPIVPEAAAERVAATTGSKAAPARTVRSARRPCSSQRCGENHRAEAMRYAEDAPRPVEATSSVRGKGSPFRIEPSPVELPAGALPFAPTAEVVIDRLRSVGGGTASLGSAVYASLVESD